MAQPRNRTPGRRNGSFSPRPRTSQQSVLPVTGKDRELVARLTAVSRSLETINRNVSDLLRRADERRDAGGSSVSNLRKVGHRLVSLAGDLTTLGVDAARWADDLDEAIDKDS
jgi:hypothetical protein